MATILDKTTRHINPFRNITFDLGTGTLPKRITPVQKFLDEKYKQEQERERKINELCEELDHYTDPSVNKETVIKWIKKTDGYYKLETYIKFVAELENSYKKSLDYSWENVAVRSVNTVCTCATGSHVQKFRMNIPVFWTHRDGHKQTFFERVKEGKSERYSKIPHQCWGHYTESQKTHDRNYAIADIRNTYLSKTKRGKKWYEMHANNYYESDEAYRAFLQEVEQKGLVKKEEKKSIYRDKLEILFPKKEYGEFGLTFEDGKEVDVDNFYSTKDEDRFEKDFQQKAIEKGDF